MQPDAYLPIPTGSSDRAGKPEDPIALIREVEAELGMGHRPLPSGVHPEGLPRDVHSIIREVEREMGLAPAHLPDPPARGAAGSLALTSGKSLGERFLDSYYEHELELEGYPSE